MARRGPGLTQQNRAADRGGPETVRTAEQRGESWLPRYGGKISSEWLFAKALAEREAPPGALLLCDADLEGDLAPLWPRWLNAHDADASTLAASPRARAQSSTATALITSSFTSEGLVSLVPALAIMLGANVGTTLIVQVLSFNIAAVAPVLFIIGLVAFRNGPRWSQTRTARSKSRRSPPMTASG